VPLAPLLPRHALGLTGFAIPAPPSTAGDSLPVRCGFHPLGVVRPRAPRRDSGGNSEDCFGVIRARVMVNKFRRAARTWGFDTSLCFIPAWSAKEATMTSMFAPLVLVAELGRSGARTTSMTLTSALRKWSIRRFCFRRVRCARPTPTRCQIRR
jgi:hypothetical protein